MAARADIQAGRAYVSLYVKNNAFTKGLRQAKQQLAQFGTDIQALGRQMFTMSAAAVVPMAFAVKQFASFDDAIRATRAVTGATESQFKSLTDTAMELGRTTSFTAVEVASLMTELGRAGFDPSQIEAMTGAVLDLSRATGTEAAQASGIMAASIRQFGMAAGDASRVADALTVAANKSFNTVEQLGEALSYAGPVAADFNMSLEDTLAILGGLGNVGIQGSNAGTAVRRLLTLTGAEAEKMKKIFGVAFLDAAGNARPLVDTLAEVNAATESLGTGERAKKFNEAFGLLGITGASAIGRSAGDIRELADALNGAQGAAAKAAEEMDAGIGGAFRKIMSAAEGVSLTLGKVLQGALDEVTQSSQDFLGIITKVIDENRDAVVTFSKWAVAIGLAGGALMGLGFSATFASIAIGGLVSIFAGIGGALALLTSPITLTVLAVGGLAIAFLDTDKIINSTVDSWKSLFGKIKTAAEDAFSGIRDALAAGDMALAGNIAMTGLQLVFAQGVDSLFKVWNGFVPKLVETFAGAMGTISKLWVGTQSRISQGILSMAQDEGIVGDLMAKLLGADVREEQKWAEGAEGARQQLVRSNLERTIAEKKAELENTDDIFDAANLENAIATFEDDLRKLNAAGSVDLVGNAQAEMRKATAEIQDELNAYWGGVGEAARGGMSTEMARLQQKLSELRAEARAMREAADAAPIGDPGDTAPDGPGGGGGGSFESTSGRSSIATYSAHAAVALGQGGNQRREELRELQKANANLERMVTKQNSILMSIDGLGLYHA